MLTRAIAAVAVATLGSLLAEKTLPTVHPDPGITVHEWGTFTTVAGVDGHAVNWLPLAGPTDLPCFVEHFRGNLLAKFAPNATPNSNYALVRKSVVSRVRMETPVLYFYASRDTTASVRVRFHHGIMTEWYPHATMDEAAAISRPLQDARQVGLIEWPEVQIHPKAERRYPTERGESHYYAARATDASPVTVGAQNEGFLFYRGIGDFDAPITAVPLGDSALRLANISGESLGNVVIFSRRGNTMGYRVVGDPRNGAVIAEPAMNGSLPVLLEELQTMLVNAGLFQREASAMVNTWRDSWFEEGTRVFYIMPRATVDGILPLEVKPVPTQSARVFVGRIEIITPGMEAAVQRGLEANNVEGLNAYGRFLGPITDRLLTRTTSASLRARITSANESAFATYLRRSAVCE